MSYDSIEQLYFQNPHFGFYFLKLTTRRLFENVSRLEGKLAERDDELTKLRAQAA
jgi:CRP/FNR family cyclic AMP-dependent transcriptional regulator